jgi:hypothetical protein
METKSKLAGIIVLLCCNIATADSSEDSLSLKDILDVKVSVASLFEERDLDIAATVFSTNSTEWRKRGALRTFEAIRPAQGRRKPIFSRTYRRHARFQ